MTIRRTPLRSALRTTSLVLGSLGLLTLAACGRPDPVIINPVVLVAPTAADTPATPGTAAAQALELDLAITSQVKSLLLGDDVLGRQTIEVQTTAGEVRLRGVLDDQAQKDRARDIARAVIGVRGIQDELTLKP